MLSFKIKREAETLATLQPDKEHCWHLVDGEMEQEQVDAIGTAIDGHYT